MFGISLLVLIIGVPVLALALCALLERGETRDMYSHGRHEATCNFLIVGAVMSILVGITWLIFGGILYLDSNSEISSLQSTRENIVSYQKTIDDTENVIIAGRNQLTGGGAVGVITDTAYANAASTYSERVKELRDMVKDYNDTLFSLRRRNSLFVIGAVTADVPADLQPITLK